jgi:hypothetical protein
MEAVMTNKAKRAVSTWEVANKAEQDARSVVDVLHTTTELDELCSAETLRYLDDAIHAMDRLRDQIHYVMNDRGSR